MPSTNTVVVGPRSDLGSNTLRIKDTNWLIDVNDSDIINCTVKLRSMHLGENAQVTVQSNNTAHVILENQYDAITPGQACVMYYGERVIGGGWIARD